MSIWWGRRQRQYKLTSCEPVSHLQTKKSYLKQGKDEDQYLRLSFILCTYTVTCSHLYSHTWWCKHIYVHISYTYMYAYMQKNLVRDHEATSLCLFTYCSTGGKCASVFNALVHILSQDCIHDSKPLVVQKFDLYLGYPTLLFQTFYCNW